MSKHIVAAALGCLLAASAAQASTITVTFKGTTFNGHDYSGFYGGGSISGLPYTAVFTIDDTRGNSTYTAPNHSLIEGGTNFGASVPVTATFTLNGITTTYAGTYDSTFEQWVNPLPGLNEVTALAWQSETIGTIYYGTYLSQGLYSYANAFIPSYDFHVPYTHTLQPDDAWIGSVSYQTYNYVTTALDQWTADLMVTSVTVGTPSIPEPATLALFGAGLTGAARLRRRAKTA